MKALLDNILAHVGVFGSGRELPSLEAGCIVLLYLLRKFRASGTIPKWNLTLIFNEI